MPESFHVNFSFSDPAVLEKIFKWPHSIFTFLWLSPLWRGPGPLFEQLEFPLPKDNLYQVWLNLACQFWRRRFLKIFSVFVLFRYFPFEMGYPLCLKKLESPFPKDDLYKVWWKLVQRFWGVENLKVYRQIVEYWPGVCVCVTFLRRKMTPGSIFYGSHFSPLQGS
jgi:hypothetical protein